MRSAFILFPNNLFKDTAPLKDNDAIYLVEEMLYFSQYRFHKQKLVFHRASMKAYEKYLQAAGLTVVYVPAADERADIRTLLTSLHQQGVQQINMYDPCDEWLEKRSKQICAKTGMHLSFISNPLFINTMEELSAYQDKRKKYFQTDFYIHQRKARGILISGKGEPLHGKWSFDADNRKKYPKGKKAPVLQQQYTTPYHTEAAIYIENNFPANPGVIDTKYYYPVTHEQAEAALHDFLKTRFAAFGEYEDAIVANEVHLHHSVLSPLLNAGLLLPMEVIEKAVDYAAAQDVPFNSLEGFVRQVLGWREFIRLVYIREGNKERTRNYWQFTRKLPASFYDGTTGIKPIDSTVKKLLKTAYNHHIERLMVLSNFMLLCEFDPDEVYRWFMEMYIDAYDWVMVPNVYGMAQFADGGLMSTKPYISSSNYLFRMSDYPKGEEWADTWDALFWRFMHVHRSFFLQNPRLGMLLGTFDKWSAAKKQQVLQKAQDFLNKLDKQTT